MKPHRCQECGVVFKRPGPGRQPNACPECRSRRDTNNLQLPAEEQEEQTEDDVEKVEKHERPADTWNVGAAYTLALRQQSTARFTPESDELYTGSLSLATMRETLAKSARALREQETVNIDGRELSTAEIWTKVAAIQAQPGWEPSIPDRMASHHGAGSSERAHRLGQPCSHTGCPLPATKRWKGIAPLCPQHYEKMASTGTTLPRRFTCEVCHRSFEHPGLGRPPKRCPEHRKIMSR